jgi:hypothetical protein
MKILKMLVPAVGYGFTGFGFFVRKRELIGQKQAVFRLKKSGTHLAFIIMVFHRILDFKNGPAFLCRALFVYVTPGARCEMVGINCIQVVNNIRKFDRLKNILPWIPEQN